MIFFPDGQTFLKVGSLSICWNVILCLLSLHIVYMISREFLKREGTSYAISEDLILGTLFFAVIAARLFYCIQHHNDGYFSQPILLLNLTDGGFDWFGGLLAGGIFAVLYCKMNRLSLLRIADVILPNAFLGLMISAFRLDRVESVEGGWIPYLKNAMTRESMLFLAGFILNSVIYRFIKKRKRGYLTYASLIWMGSVSLISDSVSNLNIVLACILIGSGAAGFFGLYEKLFGKKKPVLLFDLDGTLLDTQPAIFYSFTKLFEQYAPQRKINEEILNSVLGPPLEDSMKRYFPKEDRNALIKEYRQYNIEAHETLVKPMEGCEELLKSLKEQGYRMAIVSAKRKDMVELGCKKCGIIDYFEIILGSEEVQKHKPDPQGLLKACQMMKASKDNAVYVGDSSTDIQAAKNAGMYSIGYIFNQARKQSLLDAKPNASVEHLLEIKEILKEDHAWTIDLM